MEIVYLHLLKTKWNRTSSCWLRSYCRAPVQTWFSLPEKREITLISELPFGSRGNSSGKGLSVRLASTILHLLHSPWCQRPWWSRTSEGYPWSDRPLRSTSLPRTSSCLPHTPGPPLCTGSEDIITMGVCERYLQQSKIPYSDTMIIKCDSKVQCWIARHFFSTGNWLTTVYKLLHGPRC